jgi:hypothetical protein
VTVTSTIRDHTGPGDARPAGPLPPGPLRVGPLPAGPLRVGPLPAARCALARSRLARSRLAPFLPAPFLRARLLPARLLPARFLPGRGLLTCSRPGRRPADQRRWPRLPPVPPGQCRQGGSAARGVAPPTGAVTGQECSDRSGVQCRSGVQSRPAGAAWPGVPSGRGLPCRPSTRSPRCGRPWATPAICRWAVTQCSAALVPGPASGRSRPSAASRARRLT